MEDDKRNQGSVTRQTSMQDNEKCVRRESRQPVLSRYGKAKVLFAANIKKKILMYVRPGNLERKHTI